MAHNLGYESIVEIIKEIYNDLLPNIGFNSKISDFVKLDAKKFNYYCKLAENDKMKRFFPDVFDNNDFYKVLNDSY